jgi:hypothetical protein
MPRISNDRELRRSASENGLQNDKDSEQFQEYCRNVLRSASAAFQDADIHVAFYPYIGLTHTLRRTSKGWMLRISDHCRNAPSQVIKSIVLILGYKVMRRKPPRKSRDIYERFRMDPEVESAVRKRREEKGRKLFSNSEGNHHSLKDLYDKLNERYFNGQIEINRIGWGQRKGRGRLGHYDPIHHTITLSPSLDSSKVPSFVVQYIVYHEMLHALFGKMDNQNSQRHHPREFKHAEKAYPDFARANEFLEKFRH